MSAASQLHPVLIDQFGRRVDYIRLSITDRCDFRCVYCMSEKMTFLPRDEVLSLEECARLIKVFVSLGVGKVRITGGEPLVRKNALWLFEEIGQLPGLRELVLTTNGSQLEQQADALKRAGVKRINISLDSLDPGRFRKITRVGELEKVMRGIAAARQAEFENIKLNTVLMRGISRMPRIETLQERTQLLPCAIAAYPLYRGFAKLCGMDLVDTGFSVKEELEAVRGAWGSGYDFFFVHVKKTDSFGEDGNLEGKTKIIEEVDSHLPILLDLAPGVIVVTGDHSTPCALKGHSWHPVPFLIHSPWCGTDGARAFTESECDRGGLGVFPARNIMELALANAGKLKKHGA